jgi:hypothetical protein
MQVVDEMGYRNSSTNPICVKQPDKFLCSRGCADLSCMCGEWLLPPGWYINPFDTSGMSFFQCRTNGSLSITKACPDDHIAVYGRGCVSRSVSNVITCAGKVMKGYGVCDVSYIKGPDVKALLANYSSGRRLLEGGSAMGVAALAAGAASFADGNQAGWEPWHNTGRSLKDDFFNWDGWGYAVADTRDYNQCDQSDIYAAGKLGCFSRAAGVPLRQLDGYAGYPHNYQCRAGSMTYNTQYPGSGCWCAFRYACPNFLSTRCKDPLVLKMIYGY